MKPQICFRVGWVRLAAVTGAIGAISVLGGVAMAQERELEQEVIDGDIMYTVLPPDKIPAIFDPVFVTADSARSWMADDEMVLGVLAPDGSPRAYSAWHLDHHEIVNDRVGDVPIAATW